MITPNDVLGVPRLPPARMTAAANSVREAVGRLHRSMAPPPIVVLESLFGILDHGALVALCRAGVPESLTRPMSIADLATAVGADADQLERLVRFGSTRGWLRIDRRGRVRPTATTAFLRQDHPGGWRAWVEFAGGAEVAAGGRMHGLVLADALDWADVSTVCDVGGGTGVLLATLLDLQPNLRATVFDLPGVIERAVHHDRLTATSGDAFEAVPAGFDVYLLINVLHDWSDEDSVRMLRSIAAVADRSTRVVVVDSEHRAVPRHDIATSVDVLMAALTGGGRERDAAAFASLASAAGLRLTETTPLASGDLAHEMRLA